MKKYPSILVLKNRAMGDSIIGLGTLAYIKKILPDSHITYGCPSWILPLYDSVNTAADEYLNTDLKSTKDYLKLSQKIVKKKYDFIIELHQAGRNAKFFPIISKLSKTPYYYHNHHDKLGTFVRDQGKVKSTIQRDLDGVYSIFVERNYIPKKIIPNYQDFLPKMRSSEVIKKDENLVVLGIVASRQTKMWQLQNYKKLIISLKELNPNVRFIIPISKSELDQSVANELREKGLPDYVEFLQVDLNILPLMLATAKMYIGNDTGIKHICAALGLKTITFFGPELPMEWHPYSEKDHPYFFNEDLECRTATSHYCQLTDCESMVCLNQFKVEDICSLVTEKGFLV